MTILSARQVYWLAQHYIPFSNPTIFTAICAAESGANTLAVSYTHDYGLWQINYAAHSGLFGLYNWRNPINNAQMASSVYEAAGRSYRPWVTYTNGAWESHLAWARSGSSNPQPVSGSGQTGTPSGELNLGPPSLKTDLYAIGKQLWWGGRDMHNSAMTIRRVRIRYG